MDYYEQLGVNHTTTPDEIKKAYRKLASKHHPDKGGNAEEFKKIQEAYDTLSDPEKKYAYDNPGPDFSQGIPPGFEDLFGNIFGSRMRPQKNPDSMVNVEVTLEQCYTGTNFYLNTPHDGEVVVRIPAGIRDGARLRVPGKGRQRDPNLPPGDIFVMVNVVMPQDWGRNNDDLYVRYEIDAFDAMTGTDITVKHISGKSYSVKVPAGMQVGEKIRLTGLGLTNPTSGRDGSLYVIVEVRIPDITDQESIDLLNTIKQKQR